MLHKSLRCGSKHSFAQKNSYKNNMKNIPYLFCLDSDIRYAFCNVERWSLGFLHFVWVFLGEWAGVLFFYEENCQMYKTNLSSFNHTALFLTPISLPVTNVLPRQTVSSLQLCNSFFKKYDFGDICLSCNCLSSGCL